MTATTSVDRELHRQRFGWYAYGWASHAFQTTVVTVFMSRYLPAVAENVVGRDGRLSVLGVPVAPGSLFTYTVSLCSALLVVLMPLVGAIAARTGRKRALLLGFGYLGAFSCAAMFFVGPRDWQLGALLFVLAYLSYSSAFVVYNSLLPDLAEAAVRDRVSAVGWAAGYVGGGVLLALNFAASFAIADSALLARLSLCSAGVWWALFALVPLRLLRDRSPGTAADGRVLTAGFRKLGETLRSLARYPQTLLFLAAFLVYNDGIVTVTTVSAEYGQAELRLGESTLLGALLFVQFAAFGGALLLGELAERWGAKRVVEASLVVWTGVVVAAFWLTAGSVLQFYLLALVIALVLGGSQALSRSLFSRMIPTGREAEYFGLYEISSSATSTFGPLLFGLAYQNTGSYRTALVSLVVFFVVGLVLLARVDVDRAVRAASRPVGR